MSATRDHVVSPSSNPFNKVEDPNALKEDQSVDSEFDKLREPSPGKM